jgi:FlaG/FlaF family flagellin (archaellin)
MKGISTILAMILIVIIVVALIGMTYTFAVGLFSSTAQTTEQQTQQITGNMGKSVAIVAAKCNTTTRTYTFSIRNTGTSTIITSELAALADSTLLTVTFGDLTVGQVREFTSSALTSLPAGSHTLKISAPAGEVQETVTC